MGTLERKAIVKARVVVLVVCLILIGFVSGCTFFGGDEPDYTHWEPAVSPDGRALVYESPTDDSLELFLRNLETNEEQRLTQN